MSTRNSGADSESVRGLQNNSNCFRAFFLSNSYPTMDSHGHNFNGTTGNDSTTIVINGKIMVAAIVVLLTVVLFILGLHLYARCIWGRWGSLRRRRLFFIGNQDPPRLQRVGLSKSAIEAIPVFIYESENHKEGLECSVCLCEFEGNEKGRLLPKCHHSFHIDCIDMWFQSHSTCPLCRASALPDMAADSVVVVVEEAAAGSASEREQQLSPVSESNASISREADSDISLCSSCRHDEGLPSPTYPTNVLFWGTQNRVDSVSNPAFFDQGTTSTSRKTLDKIIIDIPRRADSFSSPRLMSNDDHQSFSPSQALKSPGARLRSLKRLLSRDKRVVPQSPDAGRNIQIEQESPRPCS